MPSFASSSLKRRCFALSAVHQVFACSGVSTIRVYMPFTSTSDLAFARDFSPSNIACERLSANHFFAFASMFANSEMAFSVMSPDFGSQYHFLASSSSKSFSEAAYAYHPTVNAASAAAIVFTFFPPLPATFSADSIHFGFTILGVARAITVFIRLMLPMVWRTSLGR